MIPSRSESNQELIRVAEESKDRELDDIKDQIKNGIHHAIYVWRNNSYSVNICHMHKTNVNILLKELKELRYDCIIQGVWLQIKWDKLNTIFKQD